MEYNARVLQSLTKMLHLLKFVCDEKPFFLFITFPMHVQNFYYTSILIFHLYNNFISTVAACPLSCTACVMNGEGTTTCIQCLDTYQLTDGDVALCECKMLY